MEPWHDFLLASAGASGALVGLLFVALSINLDQLVQFTHLLTRAAASLASLVTMLMISCMLLAPGMGLSTYGIWILALGISGWVAVTSLSWHGVRQSESQYRRSQISALILMQFGLLPTILAGIMVWLHEADGLLWLVPAFLSTLLVSLLNSWVILVEARR